MNAETPRPRTQAFICAHLRHLRILRGPGGYAAIFSPASAGFDPPPWMFVEIGTLVGPASPLKFTHAAQTHTFVPPGSVLGNVISCRAVLAAPSNVQSPGSDG